MAKSGVDFKDHDSRWTFRADKRPEPFLFKGDLMVNGMGELEPLDQVSYHQTGPDTLLASYQIPGGGQVMYELVKAKGPLVQYGGWGNQRVGKFAVRRLLTR